MWQKLEAEVRQARRKAAAMLAGIVPEILRVLAEQAAAGNPTAKRLLERSIKTLKGGGKGEEKAARSR
ncbi:MAG: hypothetical protein ACPLTR_10535 [Thermacetogeniaceae bacterium]